MIGEHRAAFEYDWRTRFHLSLAEVGRSMTYGEALRLTELLLRDPSSQLAAAREGWDAPRSREWWLLADLFDLTYRVNAKDPQPYPRPGGRKRDGLRRGNTTMTRAAVIAVLNAHGHDIPQETSSG